MPPTPRSSGPQKKSNVKVPGSADGGNRRMLLIIGAVGVVIVAAILGFVLVGGGGGGSSASGTDAVKQLEAAGCSVQKVVALKGDHTIVTPTGTSKKWNTSPPTSGPHFATAAIWGAYTTPLNPAQFVHNLEHGGIYILYGNGVQRATIDQLKTFYDSHLNATLLAPLPSLGSKIALGVWTSPSGGGTGTAYLAKCASFDDAAYAAFFKAFQFKGPERFAPSSLTPGT